MAAELQIVITGDASSAKRAMQDLIGQAKQTESAFKDIATTASGFLTASVVQKGLGALTDGLKASWNAAQETIQVQNQLNAVLKSTAGSAGVTIGQLNDMSAAFQKTTRYSDEEVGSAQALMLTFTNIKSNIFPQATQAILDMSTAMGQDLKESTIQVGKALNDPINGMTALQRVGVTFTEDQKKLVEQLVNTGQGMQAQQIILKELNTEFGGSAEAMTDQQKALDDLKDTFGEAQETIGFAMIGALTELSTWFSEHQDDIKDFFSQFEPVLNFAVEYVSTKIGAAIDLFKSLKDGISSAIDLVSDLFHGRWQDAWQDLQKVVENAVKGMLNLAVAAFGKLPNIIIDAMNSAINAVNSVQIPELKIAGHNVLPGGGGNLGVPNLPNIPTKAFDLSDVTSTFERLVDTGKAVSGMNEEVAKSGGYIPPVFNQGTDAVAKHAAAVKSAAEQLSEAFGKLTGAVTRELADKNLELAQLNLQLAQKEQQQKDTKDLDKWNALLKRAEANPGGTNMSIFNIKKQIDNAGQDDGTAALKKQIETVEKSIKVETAKTTLIEAQMKAANGALLTDAERDKVARGLIAQETLATTGFETLREKIYALFPAFNDFSAALRSAILGDSNATSNATKKFGAGNELLNTVPGHAMGLASVPYDNYVARLHKGERVLTASEASTAGGASVVHVHVQIDQREIGRAIVDLKGAGGLRGVA